MSKYFSLFQTEAQYQAAKATLDYPNVSLIDTTGDLHYAKYFGKEVVDAPFGSILMAEIATNKLFYVENSDYNTTDYPVVDFEPIGVCIYDKESYGHDRAVFLSLKFVGDNLSGKYSTQYTGCNSASVKNIIPGVTGTDYIDTIYVNKELINVGTSQPTWKTDSSIDRASDVIYHSRYAWRFKTTGTSEGDWLVPSYYDVQKMVNNISYLLETFDNLKQNYNSSIYNTAASLQILTYREDNNEKKFYYALNGSTKMNSGWSNFYGLYSKVVFIPHVEEL